MVYCCPGVVISTWYVTVAVAPVLLSLRASLSLTESEAKRPTLLDLTNVVIFAKAEGK